MDVAFERTSMAPGAWARASASQRGASLASASRSQADRPSTDSDASRTLVPSGGQAPHVVGVPSGAVTSDETVSILVLPSTIQRGPG